MYRYSSGDYGLEVLADNILPELTVSQLLVYALGFNEITLDAEVELTIRDAPLREFTISIPDGYTVAQLSAAALADYFLGPAENGKASPAPRVLPAARGAALDPASLWSKTRRSRAMCGRSPGSTTSR